jgi:hypothetical protein
MANGTIAFDTLQTSGQITGTAKSVDTDYVVNGSAKSFETHDGDSTTFLESFNMSSITDGATGICSPVFTNNMTSKNYFTAASSGNETTSFSAARSVRHDTSSSTSTYTYAIVNSGNSLVDRVYTTSCNIGDLA